MADRVVKVVEGRTVVVQGTDLLAPLVEQASTAAAEALAAAMQVRSDDAPLVPDATGARLLFVPVADQDGYYAYSVDETGAVFDANVLAQDTPSLNTAGANGIASIVHLVGHGQSLSIGTSGAPALDITALDPGRAVMFAGSPVPGDNTTSYELTQARLGALVDLKGPSRDNNETILPRAAHLMLTAEPSSAAVLASGHGVGGQAYSALKKGTQPYRNALFAMRRAASIARAAGLGYRVAALDWVQGENNFADSSATYAAHLVELQADFEADAKAVSGQTGIIPLVTDQLSSWTIYGSIATSGVPLGQLQASLDQPTRIVCVGPKYMLPYAAGEPHLTAAGYRRLGEYHGRALAAVEAGGTWAPMRMVSAVRTGTSLVITCNPPAGALAIDTTRVAAAAQYGLVYKNGSTNVALSSIAVSGNTITATLASAVSGTLSAGMFGTAGDNAGPTTGPRTNFRDSSTDVSVDGTPLYNWLCHCQMTVA